MGDTADHFHRRDLILVPSISGGDGIGDNAAHLYLPYYRKLTRLEKKITSQ